MVKLVEPTPRVQESYLRAVAEYRDSLANGEHHQPREHDYLHGRFLDGEVAWLEDSANFLTFTKRVRNDALPDSPRPEGWCPATHLWLVREDEYLGQIDIRHAMTDHLLEVGGLIGYDIRPSARGLGYGSHMLELALPIANALGHDPALITCDTTNAGSIRVIEKNGGVLEDERNGKLRYWVPTSTT